MSHHAAIGNDVITAVASSTDSAKASMNTVPRERKEALDELPLKRTPKEPDWAKVAKRWHEVLSRQIDYMERVRDDLWTCIGCGCLSFDRCALVNPDDAMSREGPGPRRLLPGAPRPER